MKSEQSTSKNSPLLPLFLLGFIAAVAFAAWKLTPEPMPHQAPYDFGDQVARLFNGH